MKVCFKPWVLVSADYDTGAIGVEKEYLGVFRRIFKKKMLYREIDEWVAGEGLIDLVLGGWSRG